jgi:hypothetical protein
VVSPEIYMGRAPMAALSHGRVILGWWALRASPETSSLDVATILAACLTTLEGKALEGELAEWQITLLIQ